MAQRTETCSLLMGNMKIRVAVSPPFMQIQDLSGSLMAILKLCNPEFLTPILNLMFLSEISLIIVSFHLYQLCHILHYCSYMKWGSSDLCMYPVILGQLWL